MQKHTLPQRNKNYIELRIQITNRELSKKELRPEK